MSPVIRTCASPPQTSTTSTSPPVERQLARWRPAQGPPTSSSTRCERGGGEQVAALPRVAGPGPRTPLATCSTSGSAASAQPVQAAPPRSARPAAAPHPDRHGALPPSGRHDRSRAANDLHPSGRPNRRLPWPAWRGSSVVGAGLGGLAAAARLAALGHAVTVLEQAERVGGKLGWYARDGHAFDTGPSLVTLPQVYRDLFAATGGPAGGRRRPRPARPRRGVPVRRRHAG